MKDKFLSKAVPRGTRTIWRYLGALIILFTFAIGQMWGASSVIPSSPNYKDISAVVTDHVYTFECLAASITEEADATSSWIGWYSTQSSFKIYNKDGSANCMGSKKEIPNLKYDKVYFYVTKCDSFQIQAWANGSGRTLNYSYQPAGGDETTGSFTESSSTDCAHSDFISLDKTKNYTICVWNADGDEIAVTYMVFKTATPVTSYTITYDANGGTGTMENSTNTVADCGFTYEGKAFAGWKDADGNDYEVGATVEEDVELIAQWADAYAITYTVGAGSGTAPAAAQYAEGAKFNLPGQGSMVAPAGKAFDGWKANGTGDKLAAGAEYTMGDAAVAFVAQWKNAPETIFNWTFANTSNIETDNTDLSNATYGTLTTGTSVTGRLFGTNTISKNSAGYKLGNDDVAIEIQGTKDFADGDTVIITGQNGGSGDRCFTVAPSSATSAASSDTIQTNAIGSQTANSIYKVVITSTQAGEKMRVFRLTGKTMYIKSIKVIRPAAREIASTVITLSDVKVNDASISAANLATLTTNHTLALTEEFAEAPVIKFNEHTVITYTEGEPATKTTDKVYTVTATVNGEGKWQASQTINEVAYTVTATKVSSAKVYYYDGATKLGEETVAIDGSPVNAGDYDDKTLASFVGWYNNADLAEEHKIANIAALVVTKDTTVYGKWTYTYATSANIEQWVLDNGKTPNSDKTGALRSLLGARGFASNLAYEEKKVELDSLNDDKGTGRNYTYLGLKVKSAGKLLDFRLAKDNTVKVKFGNVGATPLLAINGGEYANMTIEDGVFAYTATGEDYISIKTATDAAVVFQQIMIGEDIQDVTLPEPTRHAVVLSKDGETEHGTLAVASPETYNWLAKDVEVTLTVAADEGYYIESVTLNDEALTPSENVYSFAMPNATANVVATFAEIVPNNVTYKANNGGEDADILAENATEIAGCSFTYAGHKFNGWNTEANGSGDAYAEGDAVLSPLTLYAQWKEYFVITYKDGDDVLDTEDVFVGKAPVGIADPVKAMNIFQGWTLAGSDDVIDVTSLSATTTVYAKWEAIDACFYFSAKSVAESTAIAVDEEIDNAYGGKVIAKTNNITYETLGVLVASSGSTYMKVELDYAMMEGTKISVKLAAGGTSTRGVNICYDANKDHKACPMTWSASASGEVKEFEYTLDSESALNGKKEFFIYRAANTYIQTVKVSNCAPQDYTVTYKDGETVLGTEQVFENEHPTADDINTHKKGYEFQGWAETVDGAVVDLDDITITAAKNLFAQYTVKDCSPKGVKFSMAVDGSKISANQYYPATTPAVGDLAVFATVTGGVAQAVNTSTGTTKNFEVKTTPEFRLGGNNSHMRILLDCPLAENDTIKFTKTERITLSFDSLKTKSENIAKNTSYYIVPAAYAGEDTIHIWYNSNGVSVNGVQVIRPEIYAVSFNLMGHGSAIAPVNVVKGAKIVAPTAPTDEDFAFAGWYKENTLSNAWDFDNDVVAANTTLYAKWLDMTDATLKSLKYGATDIVLEDGVYEYNVELPALSTSVPALTAETSNPGATKEITNATEFDAEGHATSTVVVTPEKEGAATQTYTVNFSKAADLPQVNVTESEVWDFSVAGSTSMENQTDVVLANVPGITNDATFNSQALKGTFNKMPGDYFQGSKLNFTTEVDGLLTITFRGTNDKARHLQVCVGEGETIVADWNYQGSGESAQQTKSVYVPVGKVTLKAFEGEAAQNARIYKMELDATADYTRTVNPNNIGTLCWTNDAILGGATLYELAGKNENNYLVFDEVEENRLEAGKPYIFVPENGNTEIKVYNTSDEAADGPINEGTGMVGTFTNLSTIDDENSPLWNKYIISNNHYVYVDYTNCRLGAYRAYITSLDDVAPMNTQEAPAPGRRRIVMGGQNQMPTGIDAINASEKPMKIMIDGQIYILRGQKMYDATGRLVK